MARRIFIKDSRTKEFVDKTADVESCKQLKGAWVVRFRGRDKEYRYRDLEAVRLMDDHVETKPDETRGTYIYEVKKSKAQNVLQYLVQFCMSQAERAKPEDLTEEEITEAEPPTPFELIAEALLTTNYDDTVLEDYLGGDRPKQRSRVATIFPFGCNGSQKRAVHEAMTNSMSLIEGPPGTGKTQTILNLIANLILQGKTIAVVSNNNSAVANVAEKLDRLGLGWLVAQLGRHTLVEEFFDGVRPEVQVEEEWRLKDPEKLQEKVTQQSARVDEIFNRQVQLQQLRLQRDAALHEMEVFCKQHESELSGIEETKDLFFKHHNKSSQLLKLKAVMTENFTPLRWYQVVRWVKYWKVKVVHANRLLARQELAVYALDLAIYRARIDEMETAIRDNEKWLKGHEGEVERYVQDSMKIFQNLLYKKFHKQEEDKFNAGNYRHAFEKFVKRYPLVTSSTYSLKTCSGREFKYDYVIIDEASQVNIPTAAVCFSMAKNVVVVGDSRQLKHIVDTDTIGIAQEMNAAYDAVQESILTSCQKLYKAMVPCTMLREHYRCHPLIVDFCNRRFYDQEMIIMSQSGGEFPFTTINVHDNEIQHSFGGSIFNQRQGLETQDAVRRMLESGKAGREIGVIAPYRAHADRVQQMIGVLTEVESDTVHRFQGREKDAIIYNSVIGRTTSFNDDPHLINVAVSRAKSKFILVGSESLVSSADSNLASLISYIRYQDPECRFALTSQRASIFDVLYEGAPKPGKGHGKESPAEAIFRGMLCHVLEGASPQLSWKFRQEYYLIELVKTPRRDERFTEEEWQYMLNGARLDFLIYDAMNQDPILAVEVDGGTHQQEFNAHHDALKDHIMSQLGIPIKRFATNSVEGQEESRLRTLLNEQYLRRNLA